MHLYNSLQLNGGTILVGPCGAGKTTCYRILSLVLNRLNAATTQTALLEEKRLRNPIDTKTSRSQSVTPKSTEFQRVDVTTFFPGAMEPVEVCRRAVAGAVFVETQMQLSVAVDSWCSRSSHPLLERFLVLPPATRSITCPSAK